MKLEDRNTAEAKRNRINMLMK
jgi:hypothetical protein